MIKKKKKEHKGSTKRNKRQKKSNILFNLLTFQKNTQVYKSTDEKIYTNSNFIWHSWTNYMYVSKELLPPAFH